MNCNVSRIVVGGLLGLGMLTSSAQAGGKCYDCLLKKFPPGLPCFFYPHHGVVCEPPRKDYKPYTYECATKNPLLYYGPSGPLMRPLPVYVPPMLPDASYCPEGEMGSPMSTPLAPVPESGLHHPLN
jgi:hypothetical protein